MSQQHMGASLRDHASRAAHGALSGLRHPATIVCAYGATALLTFGHVGPQWHRWQQRQCATLNQRVSSDSLDCYQSPIAVAIGAGLAWPLYWSWELQS